MNECIIALFVCNVNWINLQQWGKRTGFCVHNSTKIYIYTMNMQIYDE